MGILVALAVIKLLHQLSWGVSDLKRYRQIPGLLDNLFRPVAGRVHGVGLRCGGQVDHALGQVDVTLRHPQELAGLKGVGGHLEGVGVGETNVFGGKANQAAGNVKRLLAPGQHP